MTHLRLIKHDTLPIDLADLVRKGAVKEEIVTEIRLKAVDGKASSQLLKNRRKLDELLSSGKYKNFDIKLQLEVDGKSHTVNLGHLDNARAPYEYDITDKLESQGRNPDYARLKELGMELCLRLADDMGLSI